MLGWNAGAWSRDPGIPATERRARKRELLFAAGLDLFGRDGYALTSVERLCAAAEATPRDFYREFASREELLIAIHDRITTQAMESLSVALAATEAEPLERRIEAAVRAYVGVTAGDERRARIAYVEVAGVGPTVERQRLAWRERFVQIFAVEARRAVARGEAPDRDYRLTALAVVGTMNELAYQWVIQPDRPPAEEIVVELVRLIVAAMTVRPDRTPG